ncbi:MAG: hypothetical protein OXU86_07485 [Thaumarchaeota archaeon]|nr:hypothetical protein [Nitrososphaerota archaeon]RNJ73623.1 MAG: hypothetical protein EB832_01410 [Thaumarchaeota archaeon S14]RNJ74341.1 MAG: hypothetical protein EB824_03750 [Thaumarchaeota archaeon S15]MDD9813552.1 hypothetical protein [Nitrososphaerota archaeon]MDD9826591.1 hypothetical protein [Nitrososphaerota archaeon]
MSRKGKYALATERRRLVWARVIWPLVLELGEPSFTLAQYRAKRAAVCSEAETRAASRGLASLAQKGVLLREGDLYSIHYRLIPYLRMGAGCDYATAMHEAGRL